VDDRWTQADAYLSGLLAPDDRALTEALRRSTRAGLPDIQVTPTQGRLLALLARSVGARRVLEVGTLGGYSTIWLARALPPGGHVDTLEISPLHADVAQANVAAADLDGLVEIHVGPAIETLPRLAAVADAQPYDLTFIDADKPSNADYFVWALRMSRPGALIVVDNVVRDGKVADADSDDANVRGSRRVLEAMAAEPRVEATAIQTVGSKGYDGFALAYVKE
jgi:predicted O-methyltransferase YrrM